MTREHPSASPTRRGVMIGGLSALVAALAGCAPRSEAPASTSGSASTPAPAPTSTTTSDPTGDTMPTIEGVITIDSTKDVPALVAELTSQVAAKGLEVFATVDHAAGASAAGLTLRPTTLIIFGNAKGGTPLMTDVQLAGLVLPLRVLAWEDESGARHLSYEDVEFLASRFGMGEASQPARMKIAELLKAMTAAAATA